MESSTQDHIGIFEINLPATAALPAQQAQHRRRLGTAAALAIGFVLALVANPVAQAQTFSVIHNFNGTDGSDPYAGLTIDEGGNLYGTTANGGGNGTVFRLTHSGSNWTLANLYTFAGGNDGSMPEARVVFGPDGSLYGTTVLGGQSGCAGDVGCGTVFNLKPPPTALSPWIETVLYRFNGGTDGGNPYAEVTFDRAGSLYGTTAAGGIASCPGGVYGCGVVYKLTPSGGNWTETPLYAFTGGSDGLSPVAGLIFDGAGNLYGTAQGVPAFDSFGSVFELSPSGSGWTENTLHAFQNGNDGEIPRGGLIFDQSGNLYGTASVGGTAGGGTAFELTASTGWSFSTIYSIVGFNNYPFCVGPSATLAMDQAGNLYGTTACDGAFGYGSVFKLSFSNGVWTYTTLYDFTGSNDGGFPYSNVVFDANGNLYGTASQGGAYYAGVVWEITP